MPKLSDSQLVILSAAAQHDDKSALPLPKSLRLNKGAAASVLKSLVKRGLLAEQPAARGAQAWRPTEDSRPLGLFITDAGFQAIAAEPAEDTSKPAKLKRATASNPKVKPKAKSQPPAPRAGSKQDLLIGLLRRRRGATIAELAAATGWQAHSVRGAISGALKKKLGLDVTSTEVARRGRVYRITAGG